MEIPVQYPVSLLLCSKVKKSRDKKDNNNDVILITVFIIFSILTFHGRRPPSAARRPPSASAFYRVPSKYAGCYDLSIQETRNVLFSQVKTDVH